MVMVRIEHPVPDFEGWKKAFDSDPVNRKKSGVRRYRILRPVDDPRYVMIDLELDTRKQAEELLAALRVLWGQVEGKVMTNARARIVEAVEITEL
jgi:ribosomal protein L35AE/L33A